VREDGDSRGSLDEEVLFVGGKTPVQFAHCARFDGYQCCCEIGGDGEGRRVDDFDGLLRRRKVLVERSGKCRIGHMAEFL
jgi:hypothetical protein